MPKYVPGKPISEFAREYGHSDVIKLASNENPLGPSPKALSAISTEIASCNLYPDASCHQLKTGLSAMYGMPASQIVVGNGSDELLHLLGLVFLSSQTDEAIAGDPSFVRYDAAAQFAGCKLVKVPVDHEFRLDLAAMAAAATDRTRIIFLANPNNPTATMVGREALTQFLRKVSPSVVVVLDEAYYEFAESDPDYPDGRALLSEFPNLVVLRTFSKAYGLAGLRVGYGLASEAICDAIDRCRGPFNVNSIAQAAAYAALDDKDHLARTLECNDEGLKLLELELSRMGATVAHSRANFAYADFGQPAEPLMQGLLERGVIVRGGNALGTPNGLRVSVGTSDHIERFLHSIKTVLDSRP